MGKRQPEVEPDTHDDNPIPKPKRRRCRDVFWLILFMLVMVGMIVITAYAIKYGDERRLLYGRDSEGNLCGASIGVDSSRDLSTQTELFYFDLGDFDTYKRCISACPNATISVVCKYDVSTEGKNPTEIQQMVSDGYCAVTLDSRSVMNRCVPNLLLKYMDEAAREMSYNAAEAANITMSNTTTSQWGKLISSDFNARSVATMVFQDVYSVWWIMLVCCGASLILSFLWFTFLQWFGAFIIYVTVILLLGSSWAVAAYLLYNYYRIKIVHQALIGTGFGVIDAGLYNEKTLLGLGIAFAIIALILTLIICCSGKRIRLAIQIIKESSRALQSLPFIFIFPLLKYLLLLAIMAASVWIFALLSTSGEIIAQELTYSVRNESLSASNQLQQFNIPGKAFNGTITLQYLQIYYVFGFLWAYNFIIACSQCTMAGAVASWYWARDKKALPRFPLIKSLGRVLRYHLGSMALGSLIIALVQLVRLIVLEMMKRVKRSQNKAAIMCLSCLQCCLGIFEKFLRMINKNAYIEIAVYGYSFCTAARLALEIIARNAFRVFIITRIGNFFVFLGKLTICFLTVLLGLGLMSWYQQTDEPASNWAIPLILILVFAYITATGFMSIFQMAISTIFLSFCEDSERNDGSPQRPYYMSDSLRAFVDKHKFEQPKV
ncbi:hypothetical protein HK097_011137 [Rhizophlyctis rosea]|uniref:Protein PNS1 n=1 Tax=Rhizophlyctis rosea TaxID=64517 RepID=A0AAD5S6S4_9FUNG|nr:hypothetical protein HK097_011137 [Rhizophlyctis rosea]